MNELLAGLAARAAGRPDDVVLESTHENLTAIELDSAVRAMAHTLRAAGLERLGLLAQNGPGWIVVDLACQLADICLVPLPHFFSDTQLQNSIERAGIGAILTDDPERLLGIIPAQAVPFDAGERYLLTMLEVANETRPALPDGTRKITFTSGSTGEPRGVCLNTDQQLRVAQALAAAIGLHEPRHLCLLPLSTLLENVGGVYVPLLTGGTVIAPPGADIGLSGSASLDVPEMILAMERRQTTSIILLPQMLAVLVAALEYGWTPPRSLEFAAVGGGKVSADLIALARGAGLPVYEGYGLSEAASVTCLNHPGHDLPGSVGQPLAHVDVRVQHDEIIVSGNTFLGYLDDAASWYPDCVATGDLGRVDEQGFVHIDGRRKNVLISSFGRNINPEWVESQVLASPIVKQCVVFGEARPSCVALVTPADSTCSDAEIQNWIDRVNSALPDYARVGSWHRLTEPMTAGNGLMTDNGRPRRAFIERHHADVIDSLYSTRPMAETL